MFSGGGSDLPIGENSKSMNMNVYQQGVRVFEGMGEEGGGGKRRLLLFTRTLLPVRPQLFHFFFLDEWLYLCACLIVKQLNASSPLVKKRPDFHESRIRAERRGSRPQELLHPRLITTIEPRSSHTSGPDNSSHQGGSYIRRGRSDELASCSLSWKKVLRKLPKEGYHDNIWKQKKVHCAKNLLPKDANTFDKQGNRRECRGSSQTLAVASYHNGAFLIVLLNQWVASEHVWHHGVLSVLKLFGGKYCLS
ncbi:hypothetical protein L249_6570, partial [Ophiocordyceps polyrhachis-furcata BCC 54312]